MMRCTLRWFPVGNDEPTGHDSITDAKNYAALVTEDGLTWIRRSADGVHCGYWKRRHELSTPHNRDVPVAEIHTIYNLRPRNN